MKLYSVAMKIEATVYIKAESAEEAMEKANSLGSTALEVTDAGSETPIVSLPYSDPQMPDISFSTAMTVVCPYPDNTPDIAHIFDDNDAAPACHKGDLS